MHALIIEDEALIGMAIQDALRDIGYVSFDFAVSVDEAVDAAQRRCPDIITADVQLAPGNGIDAVVNICDNMTIPVIFITATGHEVKARLPGKIVVAKPFSADEIKDAVRLVLQPV